MLPHVGMASAVCAPSANRPTGADLAHRKFGVKSIPPRVATQRPGNVRRKCPLLRELPAGHQFKGGLMSTLVIAGIAVPSLNFALRSLREHRRNEWLRRRIGVYRLP